MNGVTHDVNNFLGAIMAYAELIGFEESLSDDSRRMLKEMVTGIKRSSHLLGVLTGVARPDRGRIAHQSVSELLEQALALQNYTMKLDQIQVRESYDPEVQVSPCNGPRLSLAFLFLLENAVEAVRGLPQGRREIRVSSRHAGAAVEASIWDSGPAIEGEAAERMFAPYATSKDDGHFGYGLTLARQYVEEHGGELGYDAERGFVARLPYANGLRMT